jgi:hypothetical protein
MKNYLKTLHAYQALCDHADRITVAYIKATADDTGNVERAAITFDFPEVWEDNDGNLSLQDDAKFTAEWDEYWRYGGHERHIHTIPFHLLLMDESEALAEIAGLAEAREAEEAEKARQAEERARQQRQATFEKLQAEFGEVA